MRAPWEAQGEGPQARGPGDRGSERQGGGVRVYTRRMRARAGDLGLVGWRRKVALGQPCGVSSPGVEGEEEGEERNLEIRGVCGAAGGGMGTGLTTWWMTGLLLQSRAGA